MLPLQLKQFTRPVHKGFFKWSLVPEGSQSTTLTQVNLDCTTGTPAHGFWKNTLCWGDSGFSPAKWKSSLRKCLLAQLTADPPRSQLWCLAGVPFVCLHLCPVPIFVDKAITKTIQRPLFQGKCSPPALLLETGTAQGSDEKLLWDLRSTPMLVTEAQNHFGMLVWLRSWWNTLKSDHLVPTVDRLRTTPCIHFGEWASILFIGNWMSCFTASQVWSEVCSGLLPYLAVLQGLVEFCGPQEWCYLGAIPYYPCIWHSTKTGLYNAPISNKTVTTQHLTPGLADCTIKISLPQMQCYPNSDSKTSRLRLVLNDGFL